MTLANDNGTDRQTDGQTDRQTDRRTDRVQRNMRPPPREEGRIIMGDLGRRITKHTYDHRESAFLFQRISTLIQRFNAVAVLGTFAPTTPEEVV